ncbi:MAG TPA: hypothetical protein VLD39_14125, partial [Gammaproteobacteria bacterium]|nr:hypothetical protein [Gammaproteobacteria bacterium]
MNAHLKLLSFLLFSTLLFGCPGNEPKTDACDDVECERGICNDDNGECVNSSNCIGDEQCIDGYQCVAGTCAAIFPCATDDDCDRGVCDVDRCVNAESCVDNTRCVEGYKCASGTCEVDACADVECPRGVCDPDTRSCVNGEVCTRNSEGQDCIDGYFCYGQNCELPETICEEVNCGRGICDPMTQECVDAEACTRDSECLDGNYCGDDGTCQVNQCDAQMRSCARGVCDPASASCENAENCSAANECVDGFSCVEGSCVAAGQECDGGCPGNQLCVYVEADLVGVCDENPSGCVRALDCTQSRVCNAGICGTGSPCEPDALEPNDDIANSVRIADIEGNLAEGTICNGDTDVFQF